MSTAQPYVGEIAIWAGSFPPMGWAFCDGQALPVAQNKLLHAVIGNTFGGDSGSFNLPDLSWRTPLGSGAGPEGRPNKLGTTGGQAGPTLGVVGVEHMLKHNHYLDVSKLTIAIKASPTPATTNVPARGVTMARAQGATQSGTLPLGIYSASKLPDTSLGGAKLRGEVTFVENGVETEVQRFPCLGVNFIIALSGDYPQSSPPGAKP